ncbi:MAG: phosphatidate cytidylyltransferase [FCB group bacterium]|nr:phosphatidate cytidylyltransferase [FCB group bacterium]
MDKAHKQRLIIGFTGAPIVLFAAWFGGVPFLLIVCLIASVSVYELLKLIHYPPRVLMILALISTPLCLTVLYLGYMDLVVLILLFTAIFTNISLLFYKKAEYLKMSFIGIGSILYPGLCLGTLILLRNMEFPGMSDPGIGRNIVLSVILGVYATDIAAFYIGKRFGKRPLFPSVSPKKTIEGAIAGIVACVVLVLTLYHFNFVPVFGFIDYFAIAISAGIFGQIGDLVESKIKREIGVKDSSNILLEHGGFLDRFDSLSVVAPLYWTYLYLKFFL